MENYLLEAGRYQSVSGQFYTLECRAKPFCETGDDLFYTMLDSSGMPTIIPKSRLLLDEEGESDGYSTSYSSAVSDSNQGTDSTASIAKPIKNKRGRPRKNKDKIIVNKRR